MLIFTILDPADQPIESWVVEQTALDRLEVLNASSAGHTLVTSKLMDYQMVGVH